MHKISYLLILVFGLSFLLQAQDLKRDSAYQLVWADEFDTDGAPNEEFWSHEIMRLPPNDELQYYINNRKNSFVENGVLYIRAIKEVLDGRNYTSARMVTRDKIDWRYGRVEVRAQLPSGGGTWPAIWMMHTKQLYGGWPASGEIDIMEHVGNDQNRVHATVHTKAYNHTIGTQVGKNMVVPTASNAYHVYSCEWDENYVRAYVDDSLYFTFQNEKKGWERRPFDHDFYLILNIAIGGGWGGAVNNAIFKADSSVQMKVDYVRLYKKASDFDIFGPAIINEKAQNVAFSATAFTGNYKYEWILPQSITAVSELDSNVIVVNWGCVPDTIRLKVIGPTDTSLRMLPVAIKQPKITGPVWVPDNAENINYSVDSITGSTIAWTASNGIAITPVSGNKKVAVNFANEGKLYVNVISACTTYTDSIEVKFGTGQFPYPDALKPAIIPGKIIAANFDTGGKDIAYKDNDTGNKGNVYRTNEDVDIESYDGTYTVGWFDAGEWLEYTVDVLETNYYKASIRTASELTTGKLSIYVDDVKVASSIAIPKTASWSTFAPVLVDGIYLTKGLHVIRIHSHGGFNLSTTTFSVGTATQLKQVLNSFNVFPNPANDILSVQFIGNNRGSFSVVGIDGKLVYTALALNNEKLEINVSQWGRGFYLAQFYNGEKIQTTKIVLQ